MKIYKFNEHHFSTFNDEIVFAGNSKYPVGTKIKFKDDGEYLTGTLTHPFGGCDGDVGVYLDQKGKYIDDELCLKNREYSVIDDELENFMKDYKLKKNANKFNL